MWGGALGTKKWYPGVWCYTINTQKAYKQSPIPIAISQNSYFNPRLWTHVCLYWSLLHIEYLFVIFMIWYWRHCSLVQVIETAVQAQPSHHKNDGTISCCFQLSSHGLCKSLEWSCKLPWDWDALDLIYGRVLIHLGCNDVSQES